jgi:hypothetical protein
VLKWVIVGVNYVPDNMVEIGYVHTSLLDIANFYLFEGMGKNSQLGGP